ncbi:MAG: thioesterase family protein, partial [Alphaproteobacteria bacterium]
RLPVGEWVCLDAETLVSGGGTGLAESALWDERGRIGRSAQSLLIERR